MLQFEFSSSEHSRNNQTFQIFFLFMNTAQTTWLAKTSIQPKQLRKKKAFDINLDSKLMKSKKRKIYYLGWPGV